MGCKQTKQIAIQIPTSKVPTESEVCKSEFTSIFSGGEKIKYVIRHTKSGYKIGGIEVNGKLISGNRIYTILKDGTYVHQVLGIETKMIFDKKLHDGYLFVNYVE